MKKTTSIIIILVFFISVANAQLQTADEIYNKYQEIEKSRWYLSEDITPDGCLMVINIKTKKGEIAMIKLSYIGRYNSYYELTYYYFNDKVIFIKTENCSVLDLGENSKGGIECYEYTHYFNKNGWLSSNYIQGEYKLDGEKDIIADIDFLDNEKAFLEYERASKYLKTYKSDDWSDVCN